MIIDTARAPARRLLPGSVRAGLAIVATALRLGGTQFAWLPAHFDRLIGSDVPRRVLVESGGDPAAPPRAGRVRRRPRRPAAPVRAVGGGRACLSRRPRAVPALPGVVQVDLWRVLAFSENSRRH